jgi:hypothetical protein
MAKPSRDEIQAQIDALTAQLNDDDDVELWVKDEKGRETKLTGAYAKKWLKSLGLEDDEPQGGDGDGSDGSEPPEDPPPAGNSVWGRKSK